MDRTKATNDLGGSIDEPQIQLRMTAAIQAAQTALKEDQLELYVHLDLERRFRSMLDLLGLQPPLRAVWCALEIALEHLWDDLGEDLSVSYLDPIMDMTAHMADGWSGPSTNTDQAVYVLLAHTQLLGLKKQDLN